MGFFKNIFLKDVRTTIDNYEANKSRKPLTPTNSNKLKDFVVKTVGFINSYNVGRNILSLPEYDFDEIRLAAETDSYIKKSLDKKKRLIYKAGYYLKSENANAMDYINKRFNVMSYSTRKPMEILFQEMADDIITYSNCFIVKTRINNTMPGIKAQGLFGKDPVAGYFRVDPATISIQRDQSGNILKYVQKISNGKEKSFAPVDIIHMYTDKDSNNAFGTPKIIAALEDVKILRKVEGQTLAIIHRFAIPIFHWKIGKPQQGFQASDREIDEAKAEIEGMSLDGTVITNEKTEINVLGAQGNAINVSAYLKYFEERVFSALDTSASEMGRGGAKQDADSMEGQTHDYVKSIQKVLSTFIKYGIINELLMEGGYNPILKKEDAVEYVFNEINIDTKIKVENHEMLKYQSNVQTLEETRKKMGGYKEDINTNDLYKNSVEVAAQIKITKATANAQLNTQKQMAEVNAGIADKAAKRDAKIADNAASKQMQANGSAGTGNLSNGKKPSQAPKKDSESRNRPTNQHGTTSVKVKESLEIAEKVTRSRNKHKKNYVKFYEKIDRLKDNISETQGDLDYIMGLTIDSLRLDLNEYINAEITEGKNKALSELSKTKYDHLLATGTIIPKGQLYELADDGVRKILKDIVKKIDNDRSKEHVEDVFNSLEYRFRFLLEYILPKTFWYAYLKTGQSAGIKYAKVIFGKSADADIHPDMINLNNFQLNEIPAYHAFCDCKLKFKLKEVQ